MSAATLTASGVIYGHLLKDTYNSHKHVTAAKEGEDMPQIQSTNGVVINPLNALRPDLQEVVKDILALKALEKNERFITHKAQRDLLGKLNPQDLAAVARAIAEAQR